MTAGEHQPSGHDLKALVKVAFLLEGNTSHGHATETVWAEKVSDHRYRVRNIPFYMYGVSLDDVVLASPVQETLLYSGVILPGGHSTYRLFLTAPMENVEVFLDYWGPLERVGCTYERATRRLLAVDVPPGANIYEVYSFLERGESAGVWHFEEGHCGHQLCP